jgi:hypothetical protein
MTSEPTKKSWRDVLPIHPAAEKFPMMSEAELHVLGDDIRKHGQKTPIVLWAAQEGEQEWLLDGRNRLDAMERAGLRTINDDGSLSALCVDQIKIDAVDPYAYVISVNIRRRHLNVEDRQNILIDLIARQPGKSNRQIAEDIGVDHKTVGRARAKGQQLGCIPQLTKTVGKDGKARKQPVKSAITPKPEPTTEPVVETPSAAPASAHRQPVDPNSYRTAFLLRADAAAGMAVYDEGNGGVDDQIVAAAEHAAKKWHELHQFLRTAIPAFLDRRLRP